MRNIILSIFGIPVSRTGQVRGRKISAFFICLLIAIFSWLLITLSRDYTQRFRFRASYVNLPKDRAIVNLLPDSLEMSLTASGFSLLNLKWEENKSIHIDCSVMRMKKDSLYYIPLASVTDRIGRQISSDARVLSVQPDTLFFNFSRKARKVVPVRLISTITYAKQFQLADSIRVTPSVVEVYGAEDEVKGISFVETQPLIVYNADKSISRKVAFNTHNKLVGLSSDSALVSITVDEFTEGSLEVPVSVINLPEGYSIKLFPDKVTVKYKVAISNIEKVNADLFRAVVDYAEIKKENGSRLRVELFDQPSFVNSVRVNPEKVEFIIRK
ncbi:MAG: hypothetical protein AB1458_10855 [Bacteroidota bacterium]